VIQPTGISRHLTLVRWKRHQQLPVHNAPGPLAKVVHQRCLWWLRKIMEHFIIENDDSANIEFDGELIGSYSTRDSMRRATRWTVYKLYRTKGGTFVAQTIGYSQWDGEHTRYAAKVCADEADVRYFLGFSDAAKEVYAEAEIDATVKVD
jgi:hypothetical protein